VKRVTSVALCQLLILLVATYTRTAMADDQSQKDGASNQAGQGVSFVALPIPLSNPAIGSGLVVAGLALYEPANAGRAWMSGAGALYTDNKSKAAAIFQKAYFDQDRYRFTGFVGAADFNLKFYGLGFAAGRHDQYVPIEQSGNVTQLELLRRFGTHWYIGPRYRLLNLESSIHGSGALPYGVTRPELDRSDTVSSLGFVVQYDSRNNEHYPTSGIYAQTSGMYASPTLGSNRSYNKYDISFNQYLSINDSSIVAWRATACSATSGSPFYDVCLFGTSNDLRGYETGRYRDLTMAATQAEYRWRFAPRWGVVAFAGVGEVAPSFSAMRASELLPAGGIGLRFLASKDYGLNVSVDYAIGKQSNGVYFYIGEAF
jgi:outer membrane protein assembly factor BamA